jgi:hypothetical protein
MIIAAAGGERQGGDSPDAGSFEELSAHELFPSKK